ncbi:MAG: MFS transporter [Actinomycetota bacterium]
MTKAGRSWAAVGVVSVILLAMGWQFINDSSRAVPAFDTAFYQWRVEYLLEEDPGSLIELRGADGALAGGYRIAEPVTGALLRTVGGVDASVPTIVLSIIFRVLCAAGMAAFAWRHRRNWLLFYLTLLSIPALFLLQRFFGYMDNFMTLALLAGALVLLDRMPESWGARIAVTIFFFLSGLSHPTTLVILLLSLGAVAVYRWIRERSLIAALRSEGLVIATGTVGVIMTAAFWMGGLWGPTSSFSDAAVPPPADVDYFVNRSVGVLKNLQPFDQATAPNILVMLGVAALAGLMLAGFVHLLRQIAKGREYFAEVTVSWTLPLLGMLGFLIGAAYPYFRFFNATLAPLSLAALGMLIFIAWARRVGGQRLGVLALVAVIALLGGWWFRGLTAWNEGSTWLTPEIRTTTAALNGYLDADPDAQAVLVVDSQGEAQIPYGAYKEYANATYAGIDGDNINRVNFFFGRIEDLEAGHATELPGNEVYNTIASDTARDSLPWLEEDQTVVFLPGIMNEPSTNQDFIESCADTIIQPPPGAIVHEAPCIAMGTSGMFIAPSLSTADVSPEAISAGSEVANRAAEFTADPPGPFENIGSTLLAALRLALLLLPGWLFYRRFRQKSFPEALALVPLFSIASVTAVGVFAMAILRQPFSPAIGWACWGITCLLAIFWRLPLSIRARRDKLFAAPARLIDETALLFKKRDFTFLMGAQWLAQAADGLVAASVAKLITFGGQKGLDVEAAKSPRDALVIVLLTFLPYTLFSPFLGVAIDRADRRRLLIWANGVRTVVLAGIVVLGLGVIGDAALYVSLLLVLAGTRLLLAIKSASLPSILGGQDLLQGNSISQAGSALFQLFGAGVGLIASGNLPTRYILIGGVVLYALATASSIAVGSLAGDTQKDPLSHELRRVFGNMLEGFREVGRRAAARLGLLSFLTVRSMLTMVVLATGFASRELIQAEGLTSTAIPGLAGVLGAGLGFVLAHAARERVRPARIVSGALIAGAVGMLAFGGWVTILGISLMAFSVGLAFFLGKVGVDTMMQEALDDRFRGRGFSLQDIAYNISWLLPAFVLFLFVGENFGRVRPLLVIAGAVFLAIAALIALAARKLPATGKERQPAS